MVLDAAGMRLTTAGGVWLVAMACIACGPGVAGTDGDGGPGDGVPDADMGLTCSDDPVAWLGHSCEFHADCCDGQLCLAGACALPPGACATNDDCPVGFTCTGGACVGCVIDTDCGPSAMCVGGICDPVSCGDFTPEDLTGTWQFASRLNITEAVPGWLTLLGDAADFLCTWLPSVPFSGIPPWADDLVCLIDAAASLFDDMQVDHTTTMTALSMVSWHASDVWTHVVFDPDGEHIDVDPALLECPITVDDFDVNYSCGVYYLERHEVHLAFNGLVKLALDVLACEAMGNPPGCGFDAATAGLCGSLPEPFLSECEDYVDDLVVPDPCIEPTTMTLAGTGTLTTPDHMVGDWAGTLFGNDFTGTFDANR